MTSCTTSDIRKALCGLVVGLVLLASPAQAAPPVPVPGLAAAPFAESQWAISKYINKYANRAHVVQLCVVCMLLALFIIIKKLDGDDSPRPLPLREPPSPDNQGASPRPDPNPLSGPRDGVSP
jgi:hypothetical protein